MNIKPLTALNFTRMNVYLVCSWPLSPSASKSDKFWHTLRWWIVFISLLLLFLPLINGVYANRHDSLVMMKAFCMSGATGQAILKIIICKYQSSRLQILHYEMENFVKNANLLEMKYMKNYIDRAAIFHTFVTISMWVVCLDFIIEPILLSQKFPTDVAYPFSIENKYIYLILYGHQTVTLFLVAAALTIDFQVAVLLWFTGMKFEILSHYFREINNEEELRNCIVKHQHELWYADEIKRAIKYIALSTVATTTVGIVCGCLTLISRQPLSVKFRMANIVGNAATELFIYSWPADNLLRTSQAISWDIYCCDWLDRSLVIYKKILFIIRRSQKSVIIYIRGFIPNLSFQHYTSFLSTTFSYFTTMRVIYSKDTN